jgi:hypothetical protein
MVMQVPGARKTPTAVSSRTSEDYNMGLSAAELHRMEGKISTGIFHHLKHTQRENMLGKPVNLTHLLFCDRRDSATL